MAAIDLSKAKIGDKFRTRCGYILRYVGEASSNMDYKYILEDERRMQFNFFKYGHYSVVEVHKLDLVEQVFDKPLNEPIEEATKQFRESDDVITEEELQYRQTVVELAERIFLSNRGNTYSFKECVEVAEHSMNIRKQYLKEGKLC